MALWYMTENNIINYSAVGDDVDSFAQKVMRNFTQLFELVNILHSSGTVTGLTEDDAVAGEMRANLADKGLYIRSSDNKSWIRLGDMDIFLGITPEKISALRNGGKLGAFYAGTEAEMNLKKSSELSSNDIFFALDTFRVYRWTGSAWQILFSRQFADILDYEKYCVSRDEVDTSGAGKVLRLDSNTGKGNIDITGSPDRIFDKEIDFQNLRDGHAIVFNAEKNKWVNLPNYIFTKNNLTYTGEKSTDSETKIVAVGFDGKIHGSFSGDTDRIGDIEVVTDGVKNNYVLVYDESENKFVPSGKVIGSASELAGIKIECDTAKIKNDDVLAYDSAKDKFVAVPRDSFTRKNITTKGEANKIVQVADDGIIYGKFSGNNLQLGDTKLEIENLQDGDVFVYHESTKTIKNEPKNIIPSSGTGASLILYDREKVIGDYNGSKTIKIDISKVVSRAGTVSYVNQSMRLIENLYLAFDFNNMNFGGRDGLITEFFRAPSDNIDKTSALVTSIVVGDDSIDVDSVEGLIVGAWYRLVENNQFEDVQIKEIKIVGSINRVIFENPVTKIFTPNETMLYRSTAIFGEGYVTGDNVMLTTKLFNFNYDVGRTHMTVKHEKIQDAEISAEMSIHYDAKFVKGEIIGIGDGTTQTVNLENTVRILSQGFNLYFDGVKQTENFSFNPTDGEVTFTAPTGAVVQADYIYNFSPEEWTEMYRNLTYPDAKNPERATTQFHYAAQYKNQAGKITAIQLKIKQNSGKVTNEILGTGNGEPQGFKLPHHALAGTISISPSTATWTYKEDLDTVIVTAPPLETIKISYNWKARPVKIDSMAMMFNE